MAAFEFIRSISAAYQNASPLTLVVTAIWTVAAGAYLVLTLYRSFAGASSKLPPGPLFHPPLFGDSILLGLGNPQLFFFSRFKRYGPVFRTKMLGSRIWVVNDWAALRAPLNDQGASLELPFKSFKALLGEPILKTPGVHGPWRKVLSAAVTGPQLPVFFPRVLAVMTAHLREWEAAGGRINIFRAARLMGVDLAVDAILQIKLPEHVDRQRFKAKVETFLDGVYSLPLRLPYSPLVKALAAREELLDVLEPEMKDLHREFVEEYKALGEDPTAYANAVMEGSDQAASGAAGAAPPAALNVSIRVGQVLGRAAVNSLSTPRIPASELTCRQATQGLLNSLVASGDTTRFALFNTWTLLAMSPRVQDKLYEEQKRVMEQYGEDLTYEAVHNMPYMDATIKECMRLLPASTGGMRRLTEDFAVDKYIIPKGEIIWYSTGLLHSTDPALWDGDTAVDLPAHMDWRNNLEGAFRPERWLSEGGLPRPRYMVTFGSGVHLCVGMNLVYMEIKMLLAMVLRKYRLRLETPDMLLHCKRLFPFFVPAEGTDGVLLEPRQAPSPAAA